MHNYIFLHKSKIWNLILHILLVNFVTYNRNTYFKLKIYKKINFKKLVKYNLIYKNSHTSKNDKYNKFKYIICASRGEKI